jgi:hypothetical protein
LLRTPEIIVFSVIMSIFVTAFNYAVEPFFFRYQKEADAKHKYAQISVYFTIACCIILLGTSLFSEFDALMFPIILLVSLQIFLLGINLLTAHGLLLGFQSFHFCLLLY